MAVLRVFQLEVRAVEVRTDSTYVLNGICKYRSAWRRASWKRGQRPVSNADLWQELDTLLEKRAPDAYRLVKVKGHSTVED
eukprot:10817282-Karenia_brevis.AAC.1